MPGTCLRSTAAMSAARVSIRRSMVAPKERVVVIEVSSQRFTKLGNLVAHPAVSLLCQHGRVALSVSR